jgi:glycosyltransferase involved in cell wall biosynthesis
VWRDGSSGRVYRRVALRIRHFSSAALGELFRFVDAIELVVSTYRNPRALSLVLASLCKQDCRDFVICVAEDGECEETRRIVSAGGRRVRHVRHPDDGFRKNKILNEAVRSSKADYLIFLDGDCLAHPRFVSRHVACAHRDRYLSGGVIRLSQCATDAVTHEAVNSGAIWQRDWLRSNGVLNTLGARAKLKPDSLGPVLDRISFARRRWLGGNASAYRSRILEVNGFDESLGYGAEDKEIGIRLENLGVRPYSIRYSAPILHLEHGRGYVEASARRRNLVVISENRRRRTAWTSQGIQK